MNYRAEVSIPRPGDVDPRTIVAPAGPTLPMEAVKAAGEVEQVRDTEALVARVLEEIDLKISEHELPSHIMIKQAKLEVTAPDGSKAVFKWESGKSLARSIARSGGGGSYLGRIPLDGDQRPIESDQRDNDELFGILDAQDRVVTAEVTIDLD